LIFDLHATNFYLSLASERDRQKSLADDCGYAPFSDDESTTRAKCYDKIRARVDGTRMAERLLNSRK
jgi:hypothetical protein